MYISTVKKKQSEKYFLILEIFYFENFEISEKSKIQKKIEYFENSKIPKIENRDFSKNQNVNFSENFFPDFFFRTTFLSRKNNFFR